jgi:hypothetical protein
VKRERTVEMGKGIAGANADRVVEQRNRGIVAAPLVLDDSQEMQRVEIRRR